MKNIVIIICLFFSLSAFASGLRLSEPILYVEKDAVYSVFNISWENSWKNDKNNDAAWVFFKSILNGGGFRHIHVEETGHAVVSVFSKNTARLKFEIPEDKMGFFIYPESNYRGKIEATIKIKLNLKSFEGINKRNARFKAYGIEMVSIPAGKFTLGDPDTASLNFGGFYQPDRKGDYKGLVTIKDQDQVINIARNGDLFYRAPEDYEGDQTGIIPKTFPKGVDPYYIMKYEPTEKQYIDFLNSLTPQQVKKRELYHERGYSLQGGGIKEQEGLYSTSKPDVPCKFMSWDDAMAYADWSGLRPMTEFEFTKASRGIEKPIPKGFPWGTGTKEKIQRLPDATGKLIMINGWGENDLNDSNKEFYGASYYWVMDLSGSMWERLITVGHARGRAFKGMHGDGVLTEEGAANTEDWPDGNEETGGFGFRGGGFYGYGRDYHEFNPFSPVAYRPYGGWAGGARTNAYGARFVRSGKK